MLASHKWLQKYFTTPLPYAVDVARALASHTFEVETIKDVPNDQVLDIKVLPDRAHDCLSHRGIARELAAILNQSLVPVSILTPLNLDENLTLNLQVEEAKLCRRYQARLVEGVVVGESPAWLKEALAAIEQRSINNVVDIANYVMFDLGQPLHAFDADKLVGNLQVRLAEAGEQMTTLDGKELQLEDWMLVIADDQGPLGLAGIKGGQRAAMGPETKRLILEAANFDPVLIRRTSTQLGLRTDASKRFENGLTITLTAEAMDQFSQLLQTINAGEIKFGPAVDTNPKAPVKRAIELEGQDINRLLGVDISPKLVEDILTKLRCKASWHDNKLRVVVPEDRLDLTQPADIVEEVARLYGYDKIPSKLPDLKLELTGNKLERLGNQIRRLLLEQGFSEIYSYTLTDRGEVEIANPLAADKNFLRTDLGTNLQQKITANLNHLLFEAEAMKLFEIGHVFKAGKEFVNLAVGVGWRSKKYKSDLLTPVVEDLKKICGVTTELELKQTEVLDFFELVDLEELAVKLDKLPATDLAPYLTPSARYQPIILYPRISRDVALWVPVGTEVSTIQAVIKQQAGPLLVEGPVSFDEFQKDGRLSYALRSVFQSPDRTLTDEEVNQVMNGVIAKLEEQGWEVRK